MPLEHEHKGLERFGRHVIEFARKLHLCNVVLLALVNVHGHVNFGLVRIHGNLRGINAEVHVARVLVVGLEALQVSGELLARVPIVVSVEGQQPRQLEFEQLEELGIRIDAVAHDVHVTNLRHVTLFDLDADGDAVPRQFGDR